MTNDSSTGGGGRRRSAENAAKRNEKPNFLRLLHELCQDLDAALVGTRRPRLITKDMLFCLIYRSYVKSFSSQRFIPFLEEPFDKGYITHIPHANSPLNYLKLEEFISILEKLVGMSSLPLKFMETHFAIDSTPIQCPGYYLHKNKKTGRLTEKRNWIRLNIVCGVRSGVITAAKVCPRYLGEQRFFEPLLRRTAELGFKMEGIAGDKNYLSQKNIALAHEMGMQPYLTFKKNSTIKGKKSESWVESFQKYMSKEETVMKFFRKRNMIESVNSALKRKFGSEVKSKNQISQFNEVLCRVVCYNICLWNRWAYKLGIKHPTYKIDLTREM